MVQIDETSFLPATPLFLIENFFFSDHTGPQLNIYGIHEQLVF
jgi:hypothetical protein